MNTNALRRLLESVQRGETDVASALERLRDLPFADLGFATIDHHRELRTGAPEVIYSEGKTVEQIMAIVREIDRRGQTVLATRVTPEVAEAIREAIPEVEYDQTSRTAVLRRTPPEPVGSAPIAVVSAGTSDLPVAEEAAVTATVLGHGVERLYDVGVAGLHRLLHKRETLYRASVIIVVAGMEGALATVVGGLVSKPVIAVPTSVGYGASFGGLAALLAMLSSCATGVTVVNIDNGFGAACAASIICRARAD
jgi:NCAIR mutase (PurE)-related protein